MSPHPGSMDCVNSDGFSAAFLHAASRAMWKTLRAALVTAEERSRVPATPYRPFSNGVNAGFTEAIRMMDVMDAAAERELVAIRDRKLAKGRS